MGAAAATATAGGQGGVYTDKYNGYWEMVSLKSCFLEHQLNPWVSNVATFTTAQPTMTAPQ